MKLIRSFLLVLATLLPTVTFAGTFTVGVETHDYLPIYKAEGGNYTGYAREVLDAFGAKYGHSFTYKPLPINRLVDEFVNVKSIDFKFPDNASWGVDVKKGATIVYSKSLIKVTEGAMVVSSNKGKPITKIATLRGFTPFPYLDGIKAKKITVSEANSTESVISMVEAGRVDSGYLGVLAAEYTMRESMKKPNILIYDESSPHSTSDFSLATISKPEVIKQMDEFLTKEKDTVSKLKAKYKITE